MATGPGAGPAAAGHDTGPSAGAGAARATEEGNAEATTRSAAHAAALMPSAPTGAAAERAGAVGDVATTYAGEAPATRYAGEVSASKTADATAGVDHRAPLEGAAEDRTVKLIGGGVEAPAAADQSAQVL